MRTAALKIINNGTSITNNKKRLCSLNLMLMQELWCIIMQICVYTLYKVV